jgi:hypothetical protein
MSETLVEPVYTSTSSLPNFINSTKAFMSDYQYIFKYVATTSAESLDIASKQIEDKDLTIQKYGEQFIGLIKNSLEKMSDILINMNLWVKSLKTDKVETKEICIDDICIDKEDLKKMMQNTLIEVVENVDSLATTTPIAVDTEAPLLTIKGTTPLYLNLNEEYIELGAESFDVIDGDITNSIVLTGSVNTKEVGDYELVYSSVDAAGNISSKIRQVIVKSNNVIQSVVEGELEEGVIVVAP